MRHPRFFACLLVGLSTFLVGVLGNLVAAWVESEALGNGITSERLAFVLGFSLLAVAVTAWLDYRRETASSSKRLPLINETDASRQINRTSKYTIQAERIGVVGDEIQVEGGIHIDRRLASRHAYKEGQEVHETRPTEPDNNEPC